MKILILALSLLVTVRAHATSIWVTGDQAEGLVAPLVAIGMEPYGTHEFFQAGVVGCSKLFDDRGDYFPNGKIGDYVGERCLLYGSSDASDGDGRWEPEAIIPQDDRDLTKHPEIRALLAKLKAIREPLEALVVPKLQTESVAGQDVVVAQTSGFAGIACDGRNAQKQRVCQILISPKFPARAP